MCWVSTNTYRNNNIYPNDTEKLAHARKVMQRKARDNARTPVQWNAEPHGGFTAPSSKPWMRVNDDYKTINADAQLANPTPSPGTLSVHAFWKRGLENRKKHKEVFVYGDFALIDAENEKVVAWKRWSKDEAFVFVGNFSGEELKWDGFEELKIKKWVAGNYDETKFDQKETSGALTLRPWEGLLGMVE